MQNMMYDIKFLILHFFQVRPIKSLLHLFNFKTNNFLWIMCTLWWSLTRMNNERRISKFIVEIRKCRCPAPLFWKRCRVRIGCLFTKYLRCYHQGARVLTTISLFFLYCLYHFETPYIPWSWMIIAIANFITLKTLFTYPWQLIKQYKHELITVTTSSPLSIIDLWPDTSYLNPPCLSASLPTTHLPDSQLPLHGTIHWIFSKRFAF